MMIFCIRAILLCLLPAVAVGNKRRVGFWYVPQPSDLNATLGVMAANKEAITSVMIGCGIAIGTDGSVSGTMSQACVEAIPRIKALGIEIELWLDDAPSSNIAYERLFWADTNATIRRLVELGTQVGARGWNIDIEPQSGDIKAEADAAAYVGWLKVARPALAAAGMRLTLDVAQWSGVLNQYGVLAPYADRLMDMETYGATNFEGWLKGDSCGGYYEAFVKGTGVPLSAVGIGMGCWPTNMCGKSPSWTTTAQGAAQMMAQIEKDGVEEVDMFRLYGTQSGPEDQRWPQGFWWPLLKNFLSNSRPAEEREITV